MNDVYYIKEFYGKNEYLILKVTVKEDFDCEILHCSNITKEVERPGHKYKSPYGHFKVFGKNHTILTKEEAFMEVL